MQLKEIVLDLKIRCKRFQNYSIVLLFSIIPFMIFMILTHKMVFLEFGFILFGFALFSIKKIINYNDELIAIREVYKKIKTNKIKKIYPEGHHIITNPTNAILDLGGYIYIGKDIHGTKIYQNITDVVVWGEVCSNGEIVYDEFGIPAYLINDYK